MGKSLESAALHVALGAVLFLTLRPAAEAQDGVTPEELEKLFMMLA